MIEIDGSFGEGGGQIVRSSLALSAVTQTPVRISNIRAGRSRPGLLRQHLTCLKAAAEITDAKVTGDALKSSVVTFDPGEIKSGDYQFAISSAGSTSLVAQTVLPALMSPTGDSTVSITGGTHNAWAPPFDFLGNTFLPQLEKMGPKVSADLLRYGFHPAGGGKIQLKIQPSEQLRGLNLVTRSDLTGKRVTAVVSQIGKSVAKRECETIRRKSGWDAEDFEIIEVPDSLGPGNVVMITLQSPEVTEVVTGYGKQGVRAEHIARGVLKEARAYIGASVPVGEYLADQLLLPMGLAAAQGQSSRFRTAALSLHTTTHISLLERFLPIEIHCEPFENDTMQISVRPKS